MYICAKSCNNEPSTYGFCNMKKFKVFITYATEGSVVVLETIECEARSLSDLSYSFDIDAINISDSDVVIASIPLYGKLLGLSFNVEEIQC